MLVYCQSVTCLECVSCPVNSGFWAFRGHPRGHSKRPISYNCHLGASGSFCRGPADKKRSTSLTATMDPDRHSGCGEGFVHMW